MFCQFPNRWNSRGGESGISKPSAARAETEFGGSPVNCCPIEGDRHGLALTTSDIELTVEEAIAELASICAMDLIMPNGVTCQIIPDPRPLGQRLLERVNITLPDAIPHRNVSVVTRKKLVSERKVA